MRKICVVVGSRANYSSIKSAMCAIRQHPGLQLQLVTAASALLDRYGSAGDIIENDGFVPEARVYMLIEGENPTTMAKSTGLGLLELPSVFEKLKPDIVLTVGDRFETMATTLAAAYMNIPLAHTMGGEVSGNIDERIRHAVTKFANIHFPACSEARDRIVGMGESPAHVHLVGCPRIDLVAEAIQRHQSQPGSEVFGEGVGDAFDLNGTFVMVSQHPVTSEYGEGEQQIVETLAAVQRIGVPALVFWPNADAGAEDVSRGIRKFREHNNTSNFHFFKNLPVESYIRLMTRTACLVGNSSSAIREGAFVGTPSVNVGSRQNRRQRGRNVVDVDYNRHVIEAAIDEQIKRGQYPSEPIYGHGDAGKRIAAVLSECPLRTHKQMTY